MKRRCSFNSLFSTSPLPASCAASIASSQSEKKRGGSSISSAFKKTILTPYSKYRFSLLSPWLRSSPFFRVDVTFSSSLFLPYSIFSNSHAVHLWRCETFCDQAGRREKKKKWRWPHWEGEKWKFMRTTKGVKWSDAAFLLLFTGHTSSRLVWWHLLHDVVWTVIFRQNYYLASGVGRLVKRRNW